jgi:putative transposase
MYRVQLDEHARQELNRRAHQPDVAPTTRDRLEMLRLSDAGFSIPKIALHLDFHEQTVRHWIKVFLLEGFDALVDAPRPGKASAVTEAILSEVRSWIKQGDRIWSAGQIAEKVERDYGLRRSTRQWRRLLRREKLAYKRTSRNLKHKQDKEQVDAKQDQLEALKKRGRPARLTSSTKTKPASP